MQRNSLLFTLKALVLTCFLMSCEHIVLDEPAGDTEKGSVSNDSGDDKPVGHTSLNIVTRASDGSELLYPLYVYAFHTNGKLECQTIIEDASTPIKLSLPKEHTYKLVVISADNSISLPNNPELNTEISFAYSNETRTNYTTTQPLMLGICDVAINSSSRAKCEVNVNYRMTSLSAQLHGLPSGCSDVTISVSSTCSAVTFNGNEIQTPSTTTISLNQSVDENGQPVWMTGTVYLFPTIAPSTYITISFTADDEMHSSSVTYQSTLRPGTPYEINGTFNDGLLHVDADVNVSEWMDKVPLNFEFGDNLNPMINAFGQVVKNDGEVDDSSAVNVSVIPKAYSIWEDHVVAAVLDVEGTPVSDEEPPTQAMLMLLSRKDFKGVVSANNTTSPNAVSDSTKYYIESGLGNWRIPTEQEAKILYNSYWGILNGGSITSDLSPLNTLLKHNAIDPVCLDSKERYLCGEGKMAFGFYQDGYIAPAGKDKEYHLRLVHTVKVTTK